MTERHEYVHSSALLPGIISTTVGYRSTGAAEGVHRGLPSPYLTFIFSLDDPIVTAVDPGRLATPAAEKTSIITGGLHTAPAYVRQPPAQAGIQMAVHPLAARALFGATTAELGFPVDDGEDVLGPEAERLRVRLAELPDWPAQFLLLRDYLRRRVGDGDLGAGVRPEITEAWTWLAR
ncbi:MAG: AraC family transcriptional regulator, partial [Nakamurella sp.]